MAGVRRATVAGGFVASALVWLPINVDMVREAYGLDTGWNFMVWTFLGMASPIIVAVGMGIGAAVGRRRHRAG